MSINDVELSKAQPPLVEKSKKEGGKRIATRLTEFGRGEAKNHWKSLLKEVGPDADLAEIRKTAGLAIQKFKEDPQYANQKDFLRLMELSFERRLDYQERMGFLAEMKTSNSPWTRTLKTIQETLYPRLPLGFVENFSAPLMMYLKKSIQSRAIVYFKEGKIREEDKGFLIAAYESETASLLSNFLKQTEIEELKRIKAGGLKNLALVALHRRAGGRGLPIGERDKQLKNFINDFLDTGLELHLPKKKEIAGVRVENIQAPKPEKQPSRLKAILNRLIPSAGFRRKAVQAILTGVLSLNLLISSVGPIQRAKEIKPAAIERIIQPPAPDWQMALSLAPVDIPPPFIPVVPELPLQPAEEVVEKVEEKPHFLKDPQLAALYEQGCLSLYEADIDGDGQPDAKILDYPAVDEISPLCAEKLVLEEFGQEHSGQERLHQFQLADDRELAVVKQTPSACALHAYFMAISFLKGFKDESGLPVVMNPLLIGENLGMNMSEYRRIVDSLRSREVMQSVYGAVSEEGSVSRLETAAHGGAISEAVQLPSLQKKEFLDFLHTLNLDLITPEEDSVFFGRMPIRGGKNTLVVPKNLFSASELNDFKERYKILFDGQIKGDVVLSMNLESADLKEIYANSLERYYQRLLSNKGDVVVLLGLQSTVSKMKHLYMILGIEEIVGKKYFHAIEGRAGEPAGWGYYEGRLIRNEDGSLYIPLEDISQWVPSFQVMLKK